MLLSRYTVHRSSEASAGSSAQAFLRVSVSWICSVIDLGFPRSGLLLLRGGELPGEARLVAIRPTRQDEKRPEQAAMPAFSRGVAFKKVLGEMRIDQASHASSGA